MFERLEDAGLVTAAVNITCYRGRTRHRTTIPGVTRSALGPKRFFFYNLFESDQTGAPAGVDEPLGGTIDDYAAAVGRWLVTRDGFDFFVFYLSDYDYLSHAHGPDSPREGIARVDRALWSLVEAAGGPDEFLDRYAVLLCSDHGQTPVRQRRDAAEALPLGGRSRRDRFEPRRDGLPARRLPAGRARARSATRPGALCRPRRLPRRGGRRRSVGRARRCDNGSLDGYPEARIRLARRAPQSQRRRRAGLRRRRAMSSPTWAARHHAGGGSHGSLVAGDSEVPVLLAGVEGEPRSITDFAPLVLSHFGV